MLKETRSYKKTTRKRGVIKQYLVGFQETGFTGLLDIVCIIRNNVFDIKIIMVKGFIVYLTLYIKNQTFWGDEAIKVIKKTGIFRENSDFWSDVFPMNYEDVFIELSNIEDGILSSPLDVNLL